jgi:hypothetical protein
VSLKNDAVREVFHQRLDAGLLADGLIDAVVVGFVLRFGRGADDEAGTGQHEGGDDTSHDRSPQNESCADR